MIEFLARKFHSVDSDDLVSIGLLALIESYRQFDEKRGSLTRFLRSQVRRRMLDTVRNTGRRESHEAPLEEAEGLQHTDKAVSYRGFAEGAKPAVKGHVTELLKKELTPLENTVVVDKFWGGLTMRAIDDKRGFLPGTARRLLTSALEKLKEVGLEAFSGD